MLPVGWGIWGGMGGFGVKKRCVTMCDMLEIMRGAEGVFPGAGKVFLKILKKTIAMWFEFATFTAPQRKARRSAQQNARTGWQKNLRNLNFLVDRFDKVAKLSLPRETGTPLKRRLVLKNYWDFKLSFVPHIKY
jgi:hypothetical protein